jgi:hypothetical protein
MNELKERLENTIITRTFSVSGMPIAVWEEMDIHCKTFYGDCRWVMFADFLKNAKVDWKYASLLERIEDLEAEVASLKANAAHVPVQPVRVFKTFGMKGD